MKTAPLKFTKNGYHYTQHTRNGDLAIYEQASVDGGKPVAFEVVRIRQRKEATSTLGGKEVRFEAHEYLPSNEDFGSYGWTFPKLGYAQEKFTALLAAPKKQAVADLAHDERTEGYARREFRTNPHDN